VFEVRFKGFLTKTTTEIFILIIKLLKFGLDDFNVIWIFQVNIDLLFIILLW
jgi:hypothetical protein